MNSHTTESFREALQGLTAEARKQARAGYEQFRIDPFSPGLHFEEVHAQKHIWSAPITCNIHVLTDDDSQE
jgi:hypothetical protein